MNGILTRARAGATGRRPSDIAALPASRWHDGDTTEPGLTLHKARTGIHLGTNRMGQPVTLPAVGPAGVRIGVLGESLFGRLLAYRLVAVGAQVTAVTRGPAMWHALREACGERLLLADDPGTWPSHTPKPPGVDEGPQVLVSDKRRPLPVSAANGRWRTVVHVRRQVPRQGGFWHALDTLLTLGAPFAAEVAPLAGDQAAQLTASLAPGEIALFRGGFAEVLRPDIARSEVALLTPTWRQS